MHTFKLFATFIGCGLELREIVCKLRETLSKLIDPDLAFLDSLCEKEVITGDQFGDIYKQSDEIQKNNQLLTYLLNNNNVNLGELMQALEETGQKHIVNFVSSDGGRIT